MRYEEYRPMIYAIRGEAFSRQQLQELLGEVIARVCNMDEPELEAVQADLADDYEALDVALDEVDDRLAQFAEPDEMDLARDLRAA